MSRIILSKYDNGEIRTVVGWDRPCNSFFWQIFNRERDGNGRQIWDYDESWEEMIAFAGYMNGEIKTTEDLIKDAPFEIKQLMTSEVCDCLTSHRYEHPDPGRVVVDFTMKPPTVEQR